MVTNSTKLAGEWLEAASPGALFRFFASLKIGVRLIVCFVAIVLLMAASHLFTLWQFDRVRRQEERMHQLDQESLAVLGVHASLLSLRDGLDEPAAAEVADRFASEADALRRDFLEEMERANQAIRTPAPSVERDPAIITILETIRSSVPGQINALTDLANAGDWPAVRLRMRNQVAPLSELTAQLVGKVDLEVSQERSEAQQSIQRLQRRVFVMHLLAAFLTLLLVSLLGMLVTRSITQPLAQLDAGAHALALGEFQYRVVVDGQDELGNLARVFNDAAQRLEALYGALKTSEERLKTVVDTAPVGIAVLDASSTVRIFNQRFLEIVGLTSEQATGVRLSDPRVAVLCEDGTPCPMAERPSQKALSTGKPVLNEVVRRCHAITGEERWILTSAWPLLHDDGSVSQVITTLTDITPQKRVEEELRSGRELLAQAQQAAQLGCFELDLRSNSVVWSEELADLFGFPREILRGRHEDWESIIYPDDRASALLNFSTTLKTGQSVAEYRIQRRSDNEIRWVESRGRVLFDPAGQPLRMVGVTMDITDRKHAEEALHRSEEEFHTIFEHAAIGMLLVDRFGHLLRSNLAFRNMLGYSESELAALTFENVTHPDDVQASRSLFQDILSGKVDRYQIRKRYLCKGGETRTGRLSLSALRTKSGGLRFCVAMVEDITSQELAEHSLLQMSSRLLRIQEEEQRRIAREVHDSTSQEITALTLNLGALKASGQTFPEKAQKQISESLALAKQVAREIRTFSYLLHPPMLRELGLWAGLRMFIQEFRERSGLRVDLDFDKELEAVQLDTTREMALYRFVQEALANVHRHSGSKTASVKVKLRNGAIEATVADAGRGMPQALLQEIRKLGGRAGGVGLAGMHERLSYAGGQLEIRSDERGTVLTAVLPVGNPAATSTGPLPRRTADDAISHPFLMKPHSE